MVENDILFVLVERIILIVTISEKSGKRPDHFLQPVLEDTEFLKTNESTIWLCKGL
jgi:hypothetical protein